MTHSIKKACHPIISLCMIIITFAILGHCHGAATEALNTEALKKDLIEAVKSDNVAQASLLISQLENEKNNKNNYIKAFLKEVESQEPLLNFAKSVVMLNRLARISPYPSWWWRKSPVTGKTPLHVAVENGNSDIVKYLILQYVNIEPTDNQGMTPLALAEVHNYPEIKSILQGELDCYRESSDAFTERDKLLAEDKKALELRRALLEN